MFDKSRIRAIDYIVLRVRNSVNIGFAVFDLQTNWGFTNEKTFRHCPFLY